ncbi:MAG: isopeptide-forming domain-containing fimbrial protein [Ruminococcus sp.]|nr:isopeptide-forming domain-containing fimbrial protein [Ruminococcus sp.]
MKNTKRARRAAAFAAAVVMAACAAIPMGSSFSASAATITVTETEANHIFKAYQIFNGTVGTDGTVSGITWGEGFTDVSNTIYTELANTKIQVDGKEIFANVSSPAEVADALSKLTSGSANTYGDMDKVASVFQKHINTANAKAFTQKTDGTGYELTDANDGYYLIVDEVPTSGSVTSVSKYFMNVAGENKAENTITPKRDQPQVMKKIKENTKYKEAPTFKNVTTDDTGYNDTADYCIGDSVPFKVYGSLPSTLDNYQNGYKYVFHDSLDTEFDVPTAVTVKVGDHYVKAATSETDKTGYWFTTNAHAFDIAFADIKSVKLYKNPECTQEADADVKVAPTDVVTVSYDAVLNATAKIGRPGQKNDVYLEYANDSNWNGEGTPTTSETPHDNVIAFTYELDLKKVDGADKSKTLAGASFVLERTVGSQKQYAVLDKDNKITDWLTTTGNVTVDTTNGTVATDGTWASVYGKTPATPTISTTETAGTFSYIGLDDGTYVVREVKAPTGYKIAAGGQEFTFVVSADTTNNQDGTGVDAEGNALKELKLYKDSIAEGNLLDTAEAADSYGKVDTSITNTSSSTLPSTGGIGTTMFYVGGGVLVAGAGVLLITKKRAKKDAE